MNYTEEVTDDLSINSIAIKKHTIIAEYRADERVPMQSYLNASIKFPQVYEMKDLSTQDKINKQLKEVAMQSLNHRNAEETIKLFNHIQYGDSNECWSGENEYNILYVGDKCISLSYEGDGFFGGANPSHFSNYVTVSLKSGELIPFTDYFSEDSIINAITSRNFEWIEGQYTGGYLGNESEAIDEFVEALKQLNDVEAINNIYNSASTYNFALDEQFAYIGIPFYDSLDGYIIFKFNINHLILNEDRDELSDGYNHEQNIVEDIANALKIVIEDDIWFRGENSSFYKFNNQDLKFEYTYDEQNKYVIVLLTKENDIYHLDETESYYVMYLPIIDNMPAYEISVYHSSLDYEELKSNHVPKSLGSGSTLIKAKDKPIYNANQEQIDDATKRIMESFKENFIQENITDIYIRYFYDVSESTVIVYSINDIQYFANADLDGRVYKPTLVNDEALSFYVQRLLQCSYSIQNEPTH